MSFPSKMPHKFIARTVLIKNNDVESGIQMINK